MKGELTMGDDQALYEEEVTRSTTTPSEMIRRVLTVTHVLSGNDLLLNNPAKKEMSTRSILVCDATSPPRATWQLSQPLPFFRSTASLSSRVHQSPSCALSEPICQPFFDSNKLMIRFTDQPYPKPAPSL